MGLLDFEGSDRSFWLGLFPRGLPASGTLGLEAEERLTLPFGGGLFFVGFIAGADFEAAAFMAFSFSSVSFCFGDIGGAPLAFGGVTGAGPFAFGGVTGACDCFGACGFFRAGALSKAWGGVT